jgi:hypothetical protein
MRPYVEDLAEFHPDVIESAWRNVRRGHKVERWPTLQSIREECLRLRDRGAERSSRPTQSAPQSKPWEEKTRRLNEMQREYVDAFCQGELAQRAKSEGWYTSLWLHCQDAAHYQAQEVLAGLRDRIDVDPDELTEYLTLRRVAREAVTLDDGRRRAIDMVGVLCSPGPHSVAHAAELAYTRMGYSDGGRRWGTAVRLRSINRNRQPLTPRWPAPFAPRLLPARCALPSPRSDRPQSAPR